MEHGISRRLDSITRNAAAAQRVVSVAMESGATTLPTSVTVYDFQSSIHITYDGPMPVQDIAAWRHAIGRAFDRDNTERVNTRPEYAIRTIDVTYEDGTTLVVSFTHLAERTSPIRVLAERAA